MRVGLAALAALAVSLAAARPARAWASVEHQEIGRESYGRACAAMAARVAATPRSTDGRPEAGVAARFERVCGANQPVLAELYGDGTAIAGDFLDHPSEFLSQAGAWRFRSKKSYYLLALENSAHFNPMSTRAWAEYHQQALRHALAAAAADGLPSVEELQLAVYESAFADHYLHDSFASGHMGFNRRASSAAAAKSFHDAWSERGRVATDRAGDRWVTFGDGRLDAPDNAAGRRHVLEAATLSIGGVLTAFVLGAPGPAADLAVWQLLPFTIEAPTVPVEMVEIFVDEPAERPLAPLDLAIRPAEKDVVMTATAWTAAPFDHAGDPIVALAAGIELGVPLVPAQTYFGAGGAVREPDRKSAPLLETGIVVPVGLSAAGLISHQVNATASWLLHSELTVVVHVEYQLNAELGDLLLNLHGGLSEIFPSPHTGYYGALGLGFVFSAAGGGVF